MNKTCARCEKTVYPTEELKCLDKVWHKGCFKCQECGMTLNMRTYKGYGKLPYCESHVPKAKHTTMAETPELKRIAENTKIQSNVKYHADFEKSKGKFTQVADDPETLRIKANTKIISNVAYHGDLEKKAQMERQRQINENGELVDVPNDNYHHQIESYATEMLPNVPAPNLPPKNHYQTPQTQYQTQQYQATTQYQNMPQKYQLQQQSQHYKPEQQNSQHYNKVEQQSSQHYNKAEQQSSQHYNKVEQQSSQHYNKAEQQNSHYQQQNSHYKPEQTHQFQEQQLYRQQQQQAQQYPKYEEYPNHQKYEEYQNQYYGQQNYAQTQNYGAGAPKIGRIQDYDPLSDGPRAPPNTQRASATLIYNSTSDGKRGAHQPQQQASRQIGRVTEMDPLAAEHHHNHNQRVYIAMYDYEANDSDEVSFREGDLISNVTSIDEGWMTGQVLRTGRTGMLPANYVQVTNSH